MSKTFEMREVDPAPPATLTDRLMSTVRSYTLGPFTNLKDPELARLFGGGGRTSAGVVVNEVTAFMFAAVYDAVNQISSDIAKMPLNFLRRREDGGTDHYVESNVYRMLKIEPNPEMGSMVFRRTLTAHALTCKGGFAEIERDGAGRPFALWLLTPDRVQPFRERLGTGKYGPLRYRIDGQKVLEAKDIIHLQGLGYDGAEAYPLITYARQAIGLALAAEQFGAAFFSNGSSYGGVLASDEDLDKDQAEELQARIAKVHQGSDRAWKMLVLGAGFKYYKTGVTPSESQMNELRDKQIEDVARFWRMPLHRLKVNKPGAVSYASVEASDLEYYKGPILDWSTLWEEELGRKMVSRLEYRRFFFKHNANAFLRGDIKSRFDALSMALDRGVINADEWRELEDMNPQVDGQGKLYLVQGAMVPKDKLHAIVDAKIQKDKQPKNAAAPAAPGATGIRQEELDAALERAVRAEQLGDAARQVAADSREALATAEASLTTTREELAERRLEVQRTQAFAEQLGLVETFVRQKHEQLQATNAELEAQLATQGGQLVVAEDAARSADVRAATAEAERDRRVLEAIAATDLATDARAQADEAQTRASTLEQQLALSTTDRTAAEAARDQAFAAAEASRTDAAAAEARRQEAQTAADIATAAADEARADAGRRLTELEAAGAAAVTAESARAQAQADLEATRAAAAAAETARQAAADVDAAQRSAIAADAEATVERERSELEAARAAAETEAAEARSAAVAAAQALADQAAASLTSREALEAETRAAHAALDQQLAAARADVARLTDTGAVLREQITLLDSTLVAERQAHVDVLRDLRLGVDVIERERQAVVQTSETLAAQATEAAASLEQARADVRTARQAETDGMAQQIAAHRGLVLETMRRMVDRETDRARGKAMTPDKLRQWIDTFYDGHLEYMRTALQPVIRIHLAFLRSDEDPVDVTRRLVVQHVADSQRQLRTVLDGEAEDLATSVHALLHRWEQERVAPLADHLMEKELTYARRL